MCIYLKIKGDLIFFTKFLGGGFQIICAFYLVNLDYTHGGGGGLMPSTKGNQGQQVLNKNALAKANFSQC
jgi:hypothetical protein